MGPNADNLKETAMTPRWNALLTALGLGGLVAGCSAPASDFDRLIGQIGGVYEAQLVDGVHVRRHTAFKAPGLDGATFLASIDAPAAGGARKVVRIRVLQLFPASEDGAIARMSTRVLAEAADGFLDAHETPALLSGLTPDRFIPVDAGCDVIWRTDGEGFEGRISPETCRIAGQDGEAGVFARIRLSAEGYRQTEAVIGADGSAIMGDPDAAGTLFVRQ